MMFLSLLLSLLPGFVMAETFIREYTYQASDTDSKVTARKNALDQLKTQVLQEVGTSLNHVITARRDGTGQHSEQEFLEVITAGVSSIVVLEEQWNGERFYLKARITVDTSQVLNALQARQANHDQLRQQQRQIRQQQQTLEQLQADVARLNTVLQKAPKAAVPVSGTSAQPSHVNPKDVLSLASLLPLLEQRQEERAGENQADAQKPANSMTGLVSHITLGSPASNLNDKMPKLMESGSVQRQLVVSNPYDEMVVIRLWQPGQDEPLKSFLIAARGRMVIEQVKSQQIESDWKVDITKPQHQPVPLFSVMEWSMHSRQWLLDLGRLKRFVERHQR